MFKKIKKKSYINFVSILCALLVPLFITGPFLPDLLVSLLSIGFLYYSFLNRKKKEIFKIYQNFYFYIFIIFCLVCIISSLLSENILFSFESSLFYFRIGIFALLMIYLINKNKKILEYFYYSFLISFIALVIDGNIQYFTGENLFGLKIISKRISSFFGNELILGSYLARLYPLFFALFIIKPKKNITEIILVSVLFVSIDVLIFISGERTAFFLFNLSTLFIIVFIRQFKLLRIIVFLCSFIIIFIIGSQNERLYSRFVETPITSMGLDKANSEKKIFTSTHDSLYRTSWNMFLDKPILGHGPKLFRVKCKDEKFKVGDSKCHTHPHNFYIQLLAETGIIGFSFLFGLLIYFFYLIYKQVINKYFLKRDFLSDYQICLLAGLLITIWPLIPNGSFFNNHLMLLYSLQIGFFRKKINIKKFGPFYKVEETLKKYINNFKHLIKKI